MPRLSITLTDSQARALDLIAAETGATKQSMIGLAISAWISDYEHDALMKRLRKERVERELDRRDAQADMDYEAQMSFDAETCEVCGAPATGGCIGPDGQHLYCEEHRALFDDDYL